VKILRKIFTVEEVNLTIQFDYGQTMNLSFPKTASKDQILLQIAEKYVENMPPDWMVAELREGEEIDITSQVSTLTE
jgi:hypothetical protein